MDSVKLHPFSIDSLTSPRKNPAVSLNGSTKSVALSSCSQVAIPAQDPPPVTCAAPVLPPYVPPPKATSYPLISFIPNSLQMNQYRFKTTMDHCAQNLMPLETYAAPLVPSPGSTRYTGVQYHWPQEPLETGLKLPSSKRIRLEHPKDVSPTSTDSGVSRCHSPGGVSTNTSNGSRSSSPIDVLGFDTNDTILAPPAALRRAMNLDINVVGTQRSNSPCSQSFDSGRSSPVYPSVDSAGREESQGIYSKIKPVQNTKSKKRPREPESYNETFRSKRRPVEDPRTDDGKPVHSYIALISKAILNNPEKRLVLSDIYQYIMDNFPYYNNEEKAWRNSIRHNLSLNECFIKVGRADSGKGNYWSIHPSCIEDFSNGEYRRRQARRRARTVVNPLDIQQTAGLAGFNISGALIPSVGPRSAPPTSHARINPGSCQRRSLTADHGTVQGSIGYVPMTATTVRDGPFHPYLNPVSSFNFLSPAPHGLVPGFAPIPQMYPTHVAAAAMNMRSTASAHAKPVLMSHVKGKSKAENESPTSCELFNGRDEQLRAASSTSNDTRCFKTNNPLAIPGLPAHITPTW